MWPFVRDGDIIELGAPEEPLLVGSIVLAELADKQFVLHRIIKCKDARLTICGDNCSKPDDRFFKDNILGVVSSIKRNGKKISLGLGFSGHLIAWLNQQKLLLPVTRSLLFFYHTVKQNIS
ncbi:MAG: S24/S26 family peptidase [Deltaproteobacteria bacterium]|nr:S24/S26 family peptidase [Deltaproteobacteria bacterium]